MEIPWNFKMKKDKPQLKTITIKILKKIKPDFIFSSGGFVSLGPGIASFFLNIPLFIHEQNSVAGSTNKLLSKISYKIFTGFPSSFKKREKVEFVGNPIRDEITNLIEHILYIPSK